jgi:hypothetical protein
MGKNVISSKARNLVNELILLNIQISHSIRRVNAKWIPLEMTFIKVLILQKSIGSESE